MSPYGLPLFCVADYISVASQSHFFPTSIIDVTLKFA